MFAVNRGNIEERIDASFYHPKTTYVFSKIKKSKYDIVPLGEVLDTLTDGTHYTPTYVDHGVKFISVTNVTENEIDFEHTKYISEKEHADFIKRCNPEARSVLLTKIGSIGRAAVIPEGSPSFSIFVSVALLKTNEKILPEYLCAYLNSDLAFKQFERHLKGIGVPDLHLENIAETLIVLPPYPQQVLLAEKYTSSIKKRKEQIKQAEELLSGMSDYILSSLDIEIKDYQSQLCGTVKLGDIKADKTFSVEHYHPERMTAIYSLKSKTNIETKKLSEIVEFCRNTVNSSDSTEKYLGLAGVESQSGELSGIDELAAGQAFVYQKGNVLYGRLRPYLNKVLLSENNGICSTEFHVMRILDENEILPEYLATIMRSDLILSQTKHMMTGNTHPRISNDDVKNLYIPIPSIEKQKEIVFELKARRMKARELKQTAEMEWQSAKEQFEKELLQ